MPLFCVSRSGFLNVLLRYSFTISVIPNITSYHNHVPFTTTSAISPHIPPLPLTLSHYLPHTLTLSPPPSPQMREARGQGDGAGPERRLHRHSVCRGADDGREPGGRIVSRLGGVVWGDRRVLGVRSRYLQVRVGEEGDGNCRLVMSLCLYFRVSSEHVNKIRNST